MKEFIQNLMAAFNAASVDATKASLYDAMVTEVTAHCKAVRYGCYNMYMYTALYKCAITSTQRKYALDEASSIIVDDAYQSHEELIANLKEFVSLSECLNEEDKAYFDDICITSLNFFKKSGKIENLKKIAEIIVSTKMLDSESYKQASKANVLVGVL